MTESVPNNSAVAPVAISCISGSDVTVQSDVVAVEEPLEIRVSYEAAGQRRQRTVSVTMRTPGHDLELAVGFLFTEGIIVSPKQLAGLHSCGRANVACVDLHRGVVVDLARLERHFYTASSCGLCGKASVEAIRVLIRHPPLPSRPVIRAAIIHRLAERAREAQAGFDRTGGLHAAALFDADGNLRCLREDVGRHNAVDKVIGAEFLNLPLWERVLFVSGRASFELVQKAAVAGIPVLAAVGAPSSLAVSLAEESGLTLVGFLRADRFNVYCGAERIHPAAKLAPPPTARRAPLSVV